MVTHISCTLQVHRKLKLMPVSSVPPHQSDRPVLVHSSLSPKHLELVGVTGMLLAAKYEEIWATEVNDFVHRFSDMRTVQREKVLTMEKNVLKINLTVPTPSPAPRGLCL